MVKQVIPGGRRALPTPLTQDEKDAIADSLNLSLGSRVAAVENELTLTGKTYEAYTISPDAPAYPTDASSFILTAEAAAGEYVDLQGRHIYADSFNGETNGPYKKYFNGKLTVLASSGNELDMTIYAPQLEGAFNDHMKSPKLTHKGSTFLWLGTSIPSQSSGNGTDYPNLTGKKLGAEKVVNRATAASHVTFSPETTDAFTDNTPKSLSMTEGDREYWASFYATPNNYQPGEGPASVPDWDATQQTLDYKIWTAMSENPKTSIVVLDHNHNDRLTAHEDTTAYEGDIEGISYGGGNVVVTFASGATRGDFAVGEGIYLDLDDTSSGSHGLCGRVNSIVGGRQLTFSLEDATGYEAITAGSTIGRAVRVDRSTLDGAADFTIAGIINGFNRFTINEPVIVLSSSYATHKDNRLYNGFFNVSQQLIKIAKRWADKGVKVSFFDIGAEIDINIEQHPLYAPDDTHPTSFEVRNVLANYWATWLSGGRAEVVNTENFITKGDSLQASSLPILSRFSGALETPNFIEGAPTTLVDEDFADISEWTVESGAPTVGPATWDPSINSLKATQDASNTAQRLSRLVAGNPSFSLEADIFVPFGAGTGVDTVNIIQVQSRDPSPTAFVSLTLIVRNGSPSLRVTWRVGPNTGATSQEFAMSVGVPLSVRVEHQQGDVAGTSSFAVFIDGVNELFLDDVDTSGHSVQPKINVGIVSTNVGDVFTVEIANLKLSTYDDVVANTPFNGTAAASATLQIVNGIIVGVT